MAEQPLAQLRSELTREPISGGAAAIVAFDGDLDLAVVDDFASALAPEALGDARAVILDLSEVRFIDSAGIHSLVRAREALKKSGRRSEIVLSPGSNVGRVLEISGLSEELAPRPDRAAALAKIAGGEA